MTAVTSRAGLPLLVGDPDAGRLRYPHGQETLRPAQVKLHNALKWQRARVTTSDGTEIFRFDAVTWNATFAPGDYIVEVDDRKIPFSAAEGAVLEVKPQ